MGSNAALVMLLLFTVSNARFLERVLVDEAMEAVSSCRASRGFMHASFAGSSLPGRLPARLLHRERERERRRQVDRPPGRRRLVQHHQRLSCADQHAVRLFQVLATARPLRRHFLRRGGGERRVLQLERGLLGLL